MTPAILNHNLARQTLHTGPAEATRPGTWRRVIAWLGTFTGLSVTALGTVAALILAALHGVTWLDLGLLAGMYVVSGVGITLGFHRLFTHRSFQTYRPVRFLLGVTGSMAFQGTLFEWVGRHRLHHKHSDKEGDPHSPHPHGPTFRSVLRAFWHSHLGWAFPPNPPELVRYAGDLRRERMLRIVNALFPLWAVLGLLIPAVIGYAFAGWYGALTGFLWGGLVRVFLLHHVTAAVNSVCHLWGSRPYPVGDQSRNNPLIGVLALGEGWHNNHHAFPSSARHGLKWWQLDVSYYLLRVLTFFRLAWKVRLPSEPELKARAAGVGPMRP